MSLQIIDRGPLPPEVSYATGAHTLTRDEIGTRYVMAAVRTLVDPNNPDDLAAVTCTAGRIIVQQDSRGSFEVPDWDPVSQKTVRDALLALARTLPDTKRTFGTRQDTDPVRHLICSAYGMGRQPREGRALPVGRTPREMTAQPCTG